MDTYDYVIIDAGSTSCVLADRLTRDPDVSVLLLEAGGKGDYHWIHIPVGYLCCIGNPRTDWLYRTREEPGLNGRSLGCLCGHVLGGCSSINEMIYMQGQREDYDGWAAITGGDSWKWDVVLPLFKANENHHGGVNGWHDANGGWRVESQRLHWQVLETFIEAAVQAGIPRTSDSNRGDNFGIGYFKVNQKHGIRWNTAKGFLRPASQRLNLTIVTGAQVRALTFDGKRCTGVTYRGAGQDYAVAAREEVILSADAVSSPQLLELADTGQSERPQALGIPVRQALPSVGENLQDHLQLRSVVKVNGVPTLSIRASDWWGKALIGMQYAFNQSGPMSMVPSQLGMFVRSNPHVSRPDVEYHVQPLSLDKFGDPLHAFNALTASVCNLRPTSRGAVHVAPADPFAAPTITPSYLSTEEDHKMAADSLRLTHRIVAQPALVQYEPEGHLSGAAFQTDEELVRVTGEIGTVIFHPVGTCCMGCTDDANAVVDAQLRVRGIEDLRVVDASVMPMITSGNTNSPMIMIVEKASEMIHVARKA